MIKYLVFHPWRVTLSVVIGALLGLVGFYLFQVNTALDAVATEDFDPEGAREAIEVSTTPRRSWVFVEPTDIQPEHDTGFYTRLGDRFDLSEDDPVRFNPNVFGEPIADEVFTSYLLIGSDASGSLADVIILALQPEDGSSPILVSLPRDLYVWNVCKGNFTRLNAGLGGCGRSASGTEMMAILVEDYTGIPVDHSARVNFEGFARLVDVMGGIGVCVDRPTRDLKAHLELLEPGCRRVDGETALAWVRSRDPEELRGETWVRVGGSDYTRQTRQQDVLFQLAGRVAGFSSPGALADRVAAVASAVRLDDSWGFGDAVAIAWRYRGIGKEEVRRFSVDAKSYRTPGGAAVLIPDRPFIEELAEVYPLP